MTTRRTTRMLLLTAIFTAATGVACAQTPAAPVAGQTQAPGAPPAQSQVQGGAKSAATVQAAAPHVEEKTAPPKQGVLVDQVIGIVNGDLVLESDVDEERRFGAFQPFSSPAGNYSRDKAIERLVDRDLILQQARLLPDDTPSPAEVTAELAQLRKDIPACKQYHCETDAGWQKFVQAQGFSMDELTQRWTQRMEILKFIEERFRAGIRIDPAEIKAYYDKSLLPEYAKQNVKPPALETISDRIQEVLLQQRVSSLLADWLLQLKAQGTVRMMRPGDVAP